MRIPILVWGMLAAGFLGVALAEEPDREHLFMEGTSIQGSVEKPHVVYIVPWKEIPSDAGDPMLFKKSFMGDILVPVDRDRFDQLMEHRERGEKKKDDSRLH